VSRLQLILHIVLLIKIHVVMCVVVSGHRMTISEQLCGDQKVLFAGCSQTTKCVLWGVPVDINTQRKDAKNISKLLVKSEFSEF
jgi:hypothetical protein